MTWTALEPTRCCIVWCFLLLACTTAPPASTRECSGNALSCEQLSPDQCASSPACSRGVCTGVAGDCATSSDKSECRARPGCYWQDAQARCGGTPEPCEAFGVQTACEAQNGCDWDTRLCTGGLPYCASLSAGQCTAQPGCALEGSDAGSVGVTHADKVDLLFVIDNSATMRDKQAILARAMPGMLDRLVNPDCVAGDGTRLPGQEPCPAGTTRELTPVTDMHIGVVTSSLGGHGGDLCSPAASQWVPSQNDQAHLLPTVRANLPSSDGLGFLAWNVGAHAPAGSIAAQPDLAEQFAATLSAVGEQGCGFESTLESWYRFLVDPDPPSDVSVSNGQAVVSYPDDEILAQRAAFLRPDSLLAIIMLTDENDCSIRDGGNGWLASTDMFRAVKFRMWAPTSSCAANPNDACCRSCATNETTPPAGCVPAIQDPACQVSDVLSASEDPLNLRCFEQRRRFGIDLLYPTSRYAIGLTSATVASRSGGSVPNPIYSDLAGLGRTPRSPELVFLVGIVGVPWQDIATHDSLTGRGLHYLSAVELAASGRWSVILGDASASPPTQPRDPLMIESRVPRTGINPITGAPLAPATSDNPQQNPINGHEFVPSETAGDLEYACIFPLETPVVCVADRPACDCVPDPSGSTEFIALANRPLCQPPQGGPAGATQYWGKAYPGVRHLEVLRDFGANSIVASICPKAAGGPDSDPAFGYNAAIAAMIERFEPALAPAH